MSLLDRTGTGIAWTMINR